MSLIDSIRRFSGPRDQVGTASVKVAGDAPLRRITVRRHGAAWFEGNGTGYAPQPRRGDLRPPTVPRPGVVGRRPAGRSLPRHPRQRRDQLGESPTQSRPRHRRLAKNRGQPPVLAAQARGSARVARLRRHRLGMDPARGTGSRSGSSRTGSSTAKIKTRRASYLTARSVPTTCPPGRPRDRGRRPANLPAGEAIVRGPRPAMPPSGRYAGVPRDAQGPRRPAQLIPGRLAAGARVDMHLRDLGLLKGPTRPTASRSGRRRGGQRRAGSRGDHPALNLDVPSLAGRPA